MPNDQRPLSALDTLEALSVTYNTIALVRCNMEPVVSELQCEDFENDETNTLGVEVYSAMECLNNAIESLTEYIKTNAASMSLRLVQ